MMPYIFKRLFLMVPTLIGITLITFFIMKLAPGDPVTLKLMFASEGMNPAALAAELAKAEDPLKLPGWYEQTIRVLSQKIHGKDAGTKTYRICEWLGKNSLFYFKWLQKVMRLDFGLSSKDKRPVATRIQEALPITLALNLITIFIVYFISIPMGIWSALHQASLWDKVVMVKLFILYSLPSFWVATLLLMLFAGGEYFNWFPLMGFISDNIDHWSWWHKFLDMAWHLVLPIVVSVYGSLAFLSRFSRTNFLEIIRQDFMRTARAKGLSERTVVWKHGFRNSLIPLLTLMGTLLPALLGGSVIIEQIFSIPGMGMLSFEAVLGRDYNVIMGIATIEAFLTLLSLLLSDLLYAVVDPRISFEASA